MGSDAIAVVEAAYDLDAPERAWTTGLVGRSIPLVPGATFGLVYGIDASDPTSVRFSTPVAVGRDADFERDLLQALRRSETLKPHMAQCKVSTSSEWFGALIANTPMARFIRDHGAQDTFGCVALDAEGRGVVLSTDLPRVTRLPRATRSQWSLVGAHLASAHRLRRRRAPETDDDCVVEPGGRVVQAEGSAQSLDARERLRLAVVARDRARTRRVRANADEALALWRGLVFGRWSLVDRFESDGRRYVVARRNEPRPAGVLALTLRERQVLGHMAQGDSLKVTAYALGLALSTVSQAASRARLKLGVRDVAQLATMVASEVP